MKNQTMDGQEPDGKVRVMGQKLELRHAGVNTGRLKGQENPRGYNG